MLDHPQIQIGLRPVREFLHASLLAQQLDQRQVDVIVPGGHRLSVRYFGMALFAQVPAVHGNVLDQAGILARHARRHACLWAQLRQASLLQKSSLFQLEH